MIDKGAGDGWEENGGHRKLGHVAVSCFSRCPRCPLILLVCPEKSGERV
jgi:hypothetical protein